VSARFSVQHVAEKPRGWRVRSTRSGGHVLRIAFPAGARKKGTGKILEILHPKKNPTCEEGTCGPRSNPAELVIFTNPTKVTQGVGGRKQGGTANHKPKCACPFCKRARKNPPSPEQRRRTKAARDRAAKIRGARLKGRNPNETQQAVRLFQKFHGKDPNGIAEAQRSAVIREDYTTVGKLIALCFDDFGWPEKKITNEWDKLPAITFENDNVKLASSPNGKQLYFIGGRQNLDVCLADFDGVDPEKDFIDLGEAFVIVYEARKAHNKFEPTDWVHPFGGKKKERPRVMYDKLKKEMFLVGGEYFIDLSKELSPGIEG
jgi:hypothetical protein